MVFAVVESELVGNGSTKQTVGTINEAMHMLRSGIVRNPNHIRDNYLSMYTVITSPALKSDNTGSKSLNI
jgi:hypothetical protein